MIVNSQKQLAEALGVSGARVSQLRSAGRISPLDNGSWDVDLVRQQIAVTADVGQSIAAETRAENKNKSDTVFNKQKINLPPPDADYESVYGEDHKVNFQIARSLREREMAAIAAIDRRKAEGALVEKADVDRAAFTQARVLRDAIMNLPTKIAPLLAANNDAFECERMLKEALRNVLQDALTQIERIAEDKVNVG